MLKQKLDAGMEKKLYQRVLNSFTNATGILSAITDLEGNCILSSEQGDGEFCRLLKAGPGGPARCNKCYAQGGEQALKWKEPYIFKCYAGLISWVCPFFIGGKHIGNFICGQVRMWGPTELDSKWIRKLADENGQDPDLLLQSLNSVKLVSAMNIQAAADLALIVTGYIALSGTEIFDFHLKLRKAGFWIWAENKKQKDLDSEFTADAAERDMSDLGSRIFAETRKANIEQAKKLLEQLVLQIFIQSKGQLEVIKGRSLEFLSLLTRMSTECGVKFGEVIYLSDLKLKEIDDADTVEKAILWLLSVGKAFIDLIAEKNTDEEKGIIGKVTEYIKKNYSSPGLSVKVIAAACHMNPAYLGQLFKKKMGCSLTEYIHDIRIEQAKRLLKETDQITESIAKQTGFKDRSYFCKIFKRKTGLNPGDYKKNNILSL